MNKIIIYIIIALLIGILIGIGIGTYVTIKSVARIASGFVDEGMIRAAIYQYQNNIGNCFPSNFSI